MTTQTLFAPNRLPIIGALTVNGTICKLVSFTRDGGWTDYVYELPDSPMLKPTVFVDTEGNKWSIEQFEAGT